ncbi:hypothetical protein C8Q74DRAFT_1366741 [Fomes fomentarius]|nr:hypothetical protein C8Q74DRAFT_1366741 [Fomes fomentarius]
MLFITAATIFSALFQIVLAADFKINTLTSPVQCEPVQFTWQGGAPPYYLSLVPGGQPAATAYRQFPVQSDNSYTWKVDLPQGTTFTSELKDSTGAQAFSDVQTVQGGPDSSCVGAITGSTSSGTSPPSSGSSAASSNTATSSGSDSSQRGTTKTAGSNAASGSASGTGDHAATSTASPNGGSIQASAGAIGIAGLLGLAGAALLG